MATDAQPDNVFPSVRYEDAPGAIDWLKKAFGFTEHMVVPGEDNTIEHAQISCGQGMIMLGSKSRGHGQLDVETGPSWIYVVVDDPDAHCEQATGAGAEIMQELADEDYGNRSYTARDPEGNLWSFGYYKPEVGTE